MANFGISFLPGEGQGAGPNDPMNGQQGRLQEAVRLLNLRLPRVSGANAIAPQALMNAPAQGQGMNSAMMLQALMQMAGMGGQAGMGGAPAPRIGIGQGLPPGGDLISPPGPGNLPTGPVPPPNPRFISPPGPPNLPPRAPGRLISPPGPGNLPPNPVGGRGRLISPPGPGNLPRSPRIDPVDPMPRGSVSSHGPGSGAPRSVLPKAKKPAPKGPRTISI